MLRVLAIIALALLVVPGAAAMPTASIKIAPEREPGQTGDPYYLWTNVSEPEGPSPAKPTDDCWRDTERPPPGPQGAVMGIVQPIANWDPLAQPRLSGWFPECIATEIQTESSGADDATSARASYDVTTGRYYVAATAPADSGLPVGTGGDPISLPVGWNFQTASSIAVTGTSGATMVTDCEECPPPI